MWMDPIILSAGDLLRAICRRASRNVATTIEPAALTANYPQAEDCLTFSTRIYATQQKTKVMLYKSHYLHNWTDTKNFFTYWSKILRQPRNLGFVSISRPKCHKVANLPNASILFSEFSEVSADPIKSSTASQESYKA